MSNRRLHIKLKFSYLLMYCTCRKKLRNMSYILIKCKNVYLKSTINKIQGFLSLFIFMLLIYKTVLKPVSTYGIELWECATKSSVAVIQRYQSKLLRTITNAPWYISNQTLHSDLHIPHVRTVFRERTATHYTTLDSHPNPLMEPLVHPPNNRRLKRRWTFDEIH